MERTNGPQESAEQQIKTIRRATRKKYSTEEKIRIVLSGLRGEDSIARLGDKALRIAVRGRGASGIAFLTTFATALSRWRWSGRSFPHASSP